MSSSARRNPWPPEELAWKEKNGAGKRNRTSDLLITNQLLYRLSYSGTARRGGERALV